MRHLLTIGLVVFLLTGVAYASQERPPSGQQVVDRMISVYASCNRYVDEGEVRTIFLEKTGPRTVVNPFTTAFVRPSGFRFEYKDRFGEGEWNSYIIWKGEESVKAWWSIKPGVENPQNLSYALAAAAGVSSLASTTIPTLLMPEMTIGTRINRFSQLRIVGEEEANGSTFYKIVVTNLLEPKLTLWIDKETWLLVKTFQRHEFPTFETETTTTYRPQVDVEVAQEKLAFNAPGGK